MSHLLELALASGRVTNPPGRSSLHGEDHWKSVALLGLELARHTRRSDLRFIYSFAVLHDLCRENDGDDLQHGLRAAHLFDGLVADGYECPWAADLSYAIAHHVGSGRANSMTARPI